VQFGFKICFFMTLRCIKNVTGFFLRDCVMSEVVVRGAGKSDGYPRALPFLLLSFKGFKRNRAVEISHQSLRNF